MINIRTGHRGALLLALLSAGMTPLVATVPATQESAAPTIPLTAGLTIVTAVAMETGDGESIKRVTSVDADRVDITYSSETQSSAVNPVGELLGGGGGSRDAKRPRRRMVVQRTVLRADLKAARHYEGAFSPSHPVMFPGSTALGTSTQVLNDLKTRGDAAFTCNCGTRTAASGGLGKGLEGLLGGTAAPLEMKHLDVSGDREGLLKRVETGPVLIPVIVNGQRTQLPAIHAKGRVGAEEGDFYFLDDPQNPLALRWQVAAQRLTVVKIAFPTIGSSRNIESALEKDGRAEVYGIYFDTASDTIKAESEPVLKEIADVLAKNPSWKLGVEGHTDNVGGDSYNVDLSQRRAAAVKNVLVSRHKIAVDRLATSGLGASRPKETNETLEGRARNRRVELVRQ